MKENYAELRMPASGSITVGELRAEVARGRLDDIGLVLTTMAKYAAERVLSERVFLGRRNVALLQSISFTLEVGAAKCREIAEREM